MNGKTKIDETLNPNSATVDRNTWGWSWLSICFYGSRLVLLQIGRLTVDIYKGWSGKSFTAMGGGANGTHRYWMLFFTFGKIQWITRKGNTGRFVSLV